MGLGALTLAGLLGVAAPAGAGEVPIAPYRFDALEHSAYDAAFAPGAPWIVPAGYRQRLVSGEQDLDIYADGSDWNDMNTVNETGPRAGRYLYRTHEVREHPDGGAVSVVDLETGEAKVLVQREDWTALDGIRWTPWGTLLFAEETDGGMLYEVELGDDLMTAVAVHEHKAVGVMAHEGIEVGPDGSVYLVDEFRGGSIYRFVPDAYGDLSSGTLYSLDADGPDGTGTFGWNPMSEETAASDARRGSDLTSGTDYQRPEDVELIGDVLYVAVTEGPRSADTNGDGKVDSSDKEDYTGRVLAIDLERQVVTDFVKAGANLTQEDKAKGVTGLKSPDNLAEGPDGALWIVEDNVPSDIWRAEDTDGDGVADAVDLFASLTDPEAEGTGIYFSPISGSLLVNVQHSVTKADATWAIEPVPTDGAGTTIAVIGDSPYGAAEVAAFPAFVSGLSAEPGLDGVVHVGDIKSGSTVCSDAHNSAIRALFDAIPVPVVYTPGDNEWTDCHRRAAGAYDPLERLDAIRDAFFPNPGRTLGRAATVDAQTDHPENVRWSVPGAVIATLHVVGSNNGMSPWFGDDTTGTHADDPDRREAEVAARDAANIAWLHEAFDEAESQQAPGVVLFMQADMWDAFSVVNGDPLDGFDAFMAALAERSAAFDGEVLVVQGDSHQYLVDQPLAEGDALHGVETEAPNLTRIVIPASTASRYLRLTVDPDADALFTWNVTHLS
ncbi:MAG: DUF839 domain-containing protein [Acidimicrobiales bacterium]